MASTNNREFYKSQPTGSIFFYNLLCFYKINGVIVTPYEIILDKID